MPRISRAKGALFAFCLLALTLTCPASDRPASPFPIEIPQTFKVTLSEFGQPFYTVQLFTDGLHVKKRDGAKETTTLVRPDLKAWLKFVNRLNGLKLYRWASNYPDPGVDDGLQWKVRISFGERVITSEGSNSYPKDGDVGQPNKMELPLKHSKVFQDFLSALEELAP